MDLAVILDILVLAGLAATIFYALRLSSQLRILRDSKTELEQLVSNLSVNINRAQDAIQEMHDVAGDSGERLEGLIKEARGLSDELQLVTEIGENLADRIAHAADDVKSAKKAPKLNIRVPDKPAGPPPRKARTDSQDAFMIRDPDFDADAFEMLEDEDMDAFSSYAEKQLAYALKNRKL